MLQVKNISGGYEGRKIIENLSFSVKKGEIFGILGPNGSGKTTLLKMISGILPVKSGTIELAGKPLSAYSPKKLAQNIASLPQLPTQMFDYTVLETVALGRYPFQTGFFKRLTGEDEQIIQKAMEQTNISHLKNKAINELSGGEKQRVFLAQALVQNPVLLLLDEPTNHLDISHQKIMLDQLKNWTQSNGLTVVSIFHDLNLASLYCDKLLLLKDGKAVAVDNSSVVMNEKTIEQVYGVSIVKQSHPELARPQMLLIPEQKQEETYKVTKKDIVQTKELIYLKAASPLKTLSSAIIGGGFGWHSTFVNRHVDKSYNCQDSRSEMADFLQKIGFDQHATVAMMTAACLEDGVVSELEAEGVSVVIVVTAGLSNAVDAANSIKRKGIASGTINTWVLINGRLSDQAFIESVMTATEAKTKALADEKVLDPVSNTIATGTSTDSILVAATQKGIFHQHAGTITTLGRLIGRGVYESTIQAIQLNKKRRGRT